MLGFLAAMLAFYLEVVIEDVIDWFPFDPLLFATIGIAAPLGIAAGVFALVAFVSRGDRSLLLLVPILLALVVAIFAIAELRGHGGEEPRDGFAAAPAHRGMPAADHPDYGDGAKSS